MAKSGIALLGAALASATLWSAAAFADVTDGSIGNPAGFQRPTTAMEAPAKRITVHRKRERDASQARAPLGPVDAAKAFTAVTRSKDGTITRTPPGPELLRVLSGEKRADATAPDSQAVAGFEGGERSIIGKDERTPVADTTVYPFSAIGELLIQFHGSEDIYGCTGTLIGPSTVLTAATCIYDRENADDPWFETLSFWPGTNGEDVVPFGSFDIELGTVMSGFIDDYDGTYDSVWFYDAAILTLDQPIGDQLGWFQTKTGGKLDAFDANLVGYHEDTPVATMWRSKCRISKKNIRSDDMLHDCDSGGDGAWGAPMYNYKGDDQPRRMVAMNMGDDVSGLNWGLLFNEDIVSFLKQAMSQ